jgi:hypothetical protein
MATKAPEHRQPRQRPGIKQQEPKFEGYEYLKGKTNEELNVFLGFREAPLFKFYLEVVEKTITSIGVGVLLDTKIYDTPQALPQKQGYSEGIKFFNGILNDVERELAWRHERDAAREAADGVEPNGRPSRSVRT